MFEAALPSENRSKVPGGLSEFKAYVCNMVYPLRLHLVMAVFNLFLEQFSLVCAFGQNLCCQHRTQNKVCVPQHSSPPVVSQHGNRKCVSCPPSPCPLNQLTIGWLGKSIGRSTTTLPPPQREGRKAVEIFQTDCLFLNSDEKWATTGCSTILSLHNSKISLSGIIKMVAHHPHVNLAIAAI